MINKKVDFHKLGDELWSIAKIFRDDTLKTTEYLEEFSYFLFLKLFDDQERQKEGAYKIEGKIYIPYLPEELRFYTWAEKIITGEIPINEVVPTVKGIFQKLSTIQDHDGKDLSLFRKLFRNHIWRIKYGSTIREVLKRLVDLELEQNFDVLGRAYEFVVQKLGEQSQYGQYFTPRHIIHFMVELADLEIGEKIYDPAAGTGGFILRAFEVVAKKINDKYIYDYSLAEKYLRKLKEKCLWGVEKAADVYKLALMNMILHNDGKSNLYESDSLSNRAQLDHKQKYDVALSNPPYGPLTQSRVGIFEFHIKRFEALFFQHIMNALKFSESGKKPSRAVVIILDKILFDPSNAYKNIRKKLLREYNLRAIFSMPAGIFQPYSGVKTSVLYFEKPTKSQWEELKKDNDYATKFVLFFDVKSDGFTLSTQRRPINGAFQGDNPNIYNPPCGDLPKAIEIFKEWLKVLDIKKLEDFGKNYVDNEQIWVTDLETIKKNDFNLNPVIYKTKEKRKKISNVKLGKVLKVLNEERKFKVEDNVIYKEPTISSKNNKITIRTVGKLPRIVMGKDLKVKTRYMIKKGDLVFSLMHTQNGLFAVSDDEYAATSNFLITRIKKDIINERYLLYILKKVLKKLKTLDSVGRENYKKEDILNLEIPLPPLEVQQQIVERLDKQKEIIEKSKEMENAILNAGIDEAIFKGNWKWVELGELVVFKGGLSISINDKLDENGIPIITINDISRDGNLIKENIRKIKINKKKLTFIEKGELLFNWRNGSKELVGKTALYDLERPSLFASFLLGIKVKDSSILNNKFLWIILNEFRRKGLYLNLMRRNVNGVFNREELKYVKIPLPPIEKQKEIVEFLDIKYQTLKYIRKLQENAYEMIKIILEKEVFENEEETF